MWAAMPNNVKVERGGGGDKLIEGINHKPSSHEINDVTEENKYNLGCLNIFC